jgi:hypothetical protein
MRQHWTRLDPNAIDPKEYHGKTRGIHSELSLSPYDIPEGLFGYYSKERHGFVVEFKYITDEPLLERKLSEHITVAEGRNSGRLHNVYIAADVLNTEAVGAAISEVRNSDLLSKDVRRRPLNDRLFEAVQYNLVPAIVAKG